nr:hypothetical protein [uncultured Halomonas sp.]
MQARNYQRTVGAIGVALLTLSATTAMAQEWKEHAQELVEQCQQQVLQTPEGQELAGNPLRETNAATYKPGEAFELHLSFLGHGNAFHNVTCQVDEQGNVTYESIENATTPKE